MGLEGNCMPQMETRVGSARNLTLTEKLEGQKADYESRLAEVNSALDALKKNPELQNLFDLAAKIRY